jgi:hypothetical protein
MKTILIFLIPILLWTNFTTFEPIGPSLLGPGKMPAVTADKKGVVRLVYGIGDSLLIRSSVDNGQSFSSPHLITTLSGLNASATRGPQIVSAKDGVCVVASTDEGNIFSFIQNSSGNWVKTAKINDVDSVGLEGFVSVAGDGGSNLFAVWLDLRNNRRNKIYGARSSDGGRTWSENKMVYTSPDSTVCECCKPNVAMKGKNVYVMFRNWLNGNRDLHLLQSPDLGKSFGKAVKLGNGTWQLNGCPMDGGDIAISSNGSVQTVWRREKNIYSCEAGKPEIEIGEGKGCTMETINGQNIYAWTKKGEVVCVLPDKKITLGKGGSPVIKSIGNNKILCVWENENEIYSRIINL